MRRDFTQQGTVGGVHAWPASSPSLQALLGSTSQTNSVSSGLSIPASRPEGISISAQHTRGLILAQHPCRTSPSSSSCQEDAENVQIPTIIEKKQSAVKLQVT